MRASHGTLARVETTRRRGADSYADARRDRCAYELYLQKRVLNAKRRLTHERTNQFDCKLTSPRRMNRVRSLFFVQKQCAILT